MSDPAPDAELARYLLAAEPRAVPRVARIEVYRRLVRNAFRSAISTSFPETRDTLGETKFDQLVNEFLNAGGPSTPFYRDIPGDLVAWAGGIEHPYADLLQWEWLEKVAARHPADLDTIAMTPSPPGVLAPNPTIQLAVYTRPVEKISQETPQPEAFPAPMAYLVWRRPRTDETETHKVGLLLARGLALAATSPAPPAIETVADLLAREAGDVPQQTILDSLRALELELRAREGIL